MRSRDRTRPPAPLARFVARFELVDRDGPSVPRCTHLRVPDAEVELVARLDGRDVDLHVVGTRTTAVRLPSGDAPRALLVRFGVAGAYPFFGVPISELTDRVLRLDELWRDGGALRAALARARDDDARRAAVERALRTRLASSALYEPAAASAVRRALAGLSDAGPLPGVADLARATGLGERQLRRAWHEVVGVGPKRFLRIARFQRVARAAMGSISAGQRPRWSALARGAGYFDQAHMITDFKALAGTTPAALLDELVASLPE